METTFAIIKDNAPFAVMLLLAVLYLERGQDDIREEMVDIRADQGDIRVDLTEQLSEHGERLARIEAIAESNSARLTRVETILDELLITAKPPSRPQ